MKKILLTLAVTLLPMLAAAQGWPANYGGVLLQGFYWDSYEETNWNTLTNNAEELADLFDLIWIPNSGRVDATGTARQMGYTPMYWFNHNTCFGTEAELRNMIQTYRALGTGFIMDLVLNHKDGRDWVNFPQETVRGQVSGKTYSVNWDNETYAQICRNDECNTQGYTTTGADDTGENFDGARDLDHTNITTQENIRTYMDFLQNELGYVGYRLDQTKGYLPEFTGKYNNWQHPYFSVGEFWDGNADVLRWWLDGTTRNNQRQSATFDYCLKYRINDAFGSGNWGALDDKGLAADVWYNRWAVTFVDNHDTGREGNHSRMGNDNNIAAANAFILAIPGTPCIFLSHYISDKQAITNLIHGRRAAGITNQSPITVQQPSNGGYIIETQGNYGKVYLQLGPATSNGTPSGFQLVQQGNNYKFFVSNGLDWRNSTKIGGGIAQSITPTEFPENNGGTTVFIKADDQSSTHLYAWDSSDQAIDRAWPGTPVRTLPFTYVAGTKWYYKTFSQSTVNVIFNNGTGGETNQTEDIKNISAGNAFFTYSSDYTTYKNVTDAITPYIGYEIPENATPIPNHVYCYLETAEYATPHAYAWDALGKEWTGAWTGTKMTQVGTAPTGNTIWLYDAGEITDGTRPSNIIFNDGKSGGAQTEDLDFVNGGYYTLYGLLGAVETEIIEPDSVFILGEVNNVGGWFANKGFLMTPLDDHTYTAAVTTHGYNSGYSYFSFSKALAAEATDWDAIADKRFGAAQADLLINNDNLGTTLPLGSDGTDNAFKIGPGAWTFTLDTQARTLVVTKKGAFAKGDVNGDGKIDISDLNLLVNTLVGLDTLSKYDNRADINGDGKADVSDINALINIMLN